MKKSISQVFNTNESTTTMTSSTKSQQDNTVVELTRNSDVISLSTANDSTNSDSTVDQELSINEAVSRSMAGYFEHLGDQNATNLYQMVLGEVEPALLKAVLKHTGGNQSKASLALGLNRGTLRKKLHVYGIE